ncbi:MAG TPA: aldo/keto reductase [Peptostreptococcaceae bacterium]|nr:aldo/keto reductase [Peptostreptococcaceae bacterium]
MKNLGKTNLKISRVGFGGIPIQRISQEDTNKVINELRKNNINFIDTARGYTISEEYIGNAIQNDKNNWIIATKSMTRTYEGMKTDIQISLNNLKRDYVDLYQIHNLKLEEWDNIFEEAYRALLEAKDSGRIKHIGITSHSLDVIEKAIESDKFETIQFPYNIVENQADEIFKRAHEKNIGVIVMKPLAGGAIRDGKLAIKYILSKDYIDVAIPGMDSVEQVLENTSVLKDLTLNEEDLNEIDGIRSSLGNRFCRRCEYCMPCPVGINIPMNFLIEGYYTRYNLEDWANERYSALDKKAKDCEAFGLCETKCPYQLPIREMLKDVSKILDK